MKRCTSAAGVVCQWVIPILAVLFGPTSYGQTTLALSSESAASNGAVSLGLSLSSSKGNAVSALQWTLTYPVDSVVSIAAAAGTAASNSGKNLDCAANSGTLTCVVSGRNQNVIPNGTVAVINLVMGAGAVSTPILLINQMGASPEGYFVPTTAGGGVVTGPGSILPSVQSLSCTAASLGKGDSATCTVTLNRAAPSGGANVTISRTGTLLTVPTSVTVPAAATTKTFTVSAGFLTSDQDSTITATYNGTFSKFSISLVAPVLISSVSCDAGFLLLNASSTCTVTLTKPAPSGGAKVFLSRTGTLLKVPTSVTVLSGKTSITFTASVLSVLIDEVSTITSTYNGASVSTAISLVTQGSVSSISCNSASLGENSSTTCTVKLSKAAPSGGATVTISRSGTLLMVPASVLVPATATSASFQISTSGIPSNQAATVTATYNGASMSTTVNLNAPAVLSGLSCNTSALAPNSSVTCTVTLSKSTPNGGATVTLKRTGSVLQIPSSVTVQASAASATFTASTSTFSTDQSSTITATYNGTSASTTLSLGAAAVPSGLSCNTASLGPSSSATCTVTLSKSAPSGGATVTLSRSGTVLTVQGTVLVPATATSASFPVTTAAIPADQNSTLTATYNGKSVSTTLSLEASITVSGLSCNVASLEQNSSATCTVVLSKAAPSNGATVTLKRSGTVLTVPASVTVPATKTSATFTISTGAVPSDQSSTITATYAGISISTNLALEAPVLLSTFSCNPTTMGPGASSTCTVVLNRNASSSGARITVSTTNSVLSAPSSISIPSGSNSGQVTLQAGSFSSNQDGSISAAYNGSSKSVTISLVIAMQVTSLTCNPTGLVSGTTSSCSVAISQRSSSATVVTLKSSSSLLTVPASVTVTAGNLTAAFTASAGNISTTVTGTVTATLGPSSQSANLKLWPVPVLSSFTCNTTKLTVGAGAVCTVSLVNAAGVAVVALSSNNKAISVPASATIPEGSTSATFQATATALASGWVIVSAALNGVNKGQLFTIVAAAPPTSSIVRSVSCAPKRFMAGSRGMCQVTLDSGPESGTAELRLSSSSESVRVPETIQTAPGQETLEFQVDVLDSAISGKAVIGVHSDTEAVEETLDISSHRPFKIRVPGRQFVKYATEVEFQVSASDASAALSASSLPPGAYFDPTTGIFRWTPDSRKLGSHEISFGATNSSGEKTSENVEVVVDSGEPIVTGVVNAASRSREAVCGPNAIARIEGRWLSDGNGLEPLGQSARLGGTRVWVNAIESPVLSASGNSLTILCPVLPSPGPLEIVVETGYGTSSPVLAPGLAAAPGLFSMDGSGKGQGSVLIVGTSDFAMARNYRFKAKPAVAGDQVIVFATGLGALTNLSAEIDGIPAVVGDAAEEQPGIFTVTVQIPSGIKTSSSVRLALIGTDTSSTLIRTNPVTIAIEELRR